MRRVASIAVAVAAARRAAAAATAAAWKRCSTSTGSSTGSSMMSGHGPRRFAYTSCHSGTDTAPLQARRRSATKEEGKVEHGSTSETALTSRQRALCGVTSWSNSCSFPAERHQRRSLGSAPQGWQSRSGCRHLATTKEVHAKEHDPRPTVVTGAGLKTTLIMRVLQFLSTQRWVTDAQKLEWYPPLALMRIKVREISRDWSTVRIHLPLNHFSRNPGGVMFGGYQVSLADPIAAMACARKFRDYSCWTRAMTVDFVAGGSTDLELRFEFSKEKEEAILAELRERGRATPTFEYGYYLETGELCTRITNTVAIRPKGYIKAHSPPASPDGL